MKLWALAAFFTGIAVVTYAMRKHHPRLAPVSRDPNSRYDIEEFLADQEF